MTTTPRAMSRSAVTYRVGGRDYPMRGNAQCRVCMSPHRFEIEEALITGRVYAKIVDSLPEDCEISIRNVKDHYYNGHLPLEQAAVRQLTETRADIVGKRIEDSAESLVDGVTLAEVVVQKTFERIAKGEINPDITDGLRAVKLLEEMGVYDEGGVDQSAVTEAFMVYHESAMAHMTQEQFESFGRALQESPVLRALMEKFEGREQGEVVQGEVEASQTETG